MKAIRLTIDQWQHIVIEIAKHHPRSVWMVRPKMRKVLGFTPREHEEWVTFDHTGSAENPRKYLKKEMRGAEHRFNSPFCIFGIISKCIVSAGT